MSTGTWRGSDSVTLTEGHRRRFAAKVDRSGGEDACWPWTAVHGQQASSPPERSTFAAKRRRCPSVSVTESDPLHVPVLMQRYVKHARKCASTRASAQGGHLTAP